MKLNLPHHVSSNVSRKFKKQLTNCRNLALPSMYSLSDRLCSHNLSSSKTRISIEAKTFFCHFDKDASNCPQLVVHSLSTEKLAFNLREYYKTILSCCIFT